MGKISSRSGAGWKKSWQRRRQSIRLLLTLPHLLLHLATLRQKVIFKVLPMWGNRVVLKMMQIFDIWQIFLGQILYKLSILTPSPPSAIKIGIWCLDHNWDECLNLYPWSMYLGRILRIPSHLFRKVSSQTHYFHAFTGSRKFTGIRIIAQFPPSNGVVGLHTPSAPAVSKWQFSGSGISEKDRLHPWHYNLHIRPFQIFLLLGFQPLALQWVVAVRTLWYRGFK